MKSFSLTRRLLAAVIISHIVLAGCLVLIATSFARRYLKAAFDVTLEGRARSVASLVYYPDDGSPGLLFAASKSPISSHRRHLDFYDVRSDYRSFEVHTPDYNPHVFDGVPANTEFFEFNYQGEDYRAIALHNVAILDTEEGIPNPPPTLTVFYAIPSEDINERAAALAISISLASLFLVLPTLAVAVWMIRRSVGPLHALAAEARRISVRNWDFKASEQERSVAELAPLIQAIETVLDGLRRAFTRQREFLGDAAHELKTSFAIVKSSVQSLLNAPRTAAEYRDGLLEISEDSERLEDLLNRMLRLARVEQWAADGVRRELEITDLRSTCEMAVARIGKLAASRAIKVELTGTESAQLRADPADLELVWMNLLENAVQYSGSGSVVAMVVRVETQRATVSVQDHGCGIPTADLPYIFERFRRSDPSRSRATGGFGLGLAMAKSIVEAYGGTIHASSTEGVGTIIKVSVPIVLQTHAPAVRAQSSRLQPTSRIS
jgi:signal transduction histidine kinase